MAARPMPARSASTEARVPSGSQAPPHVHSREEETFLVLGGRVAFTVGDATGEAGPGAAVARFGVELLA